MSDEKTEVIAGTTAVQLLCAQFLQLQRSAVRQLAEAAFEAQGLPEGQGWELNVEHGAFVRVKRGS